MLLVDLKLKNQQMFLQCLLFRKKFFTMEKYVLCTEWYKKSPRYIEEQPYTNHLFREPVQRLIIYSGSSVSLHLKYEC